MNIDFVAILNAAITESVGALVTQQLALIVKPIEDMAEKVHNLTLRVADLAKEFRVSESLIRAIRDNKAWLATST